VEEQGVVRPSWARQKIARATIERHVFYR
jgi:hypothetical protein